MKTCIRCNEEKQSKEFYKNSSKKDKLDTYCIPCTKEKLHIHYLKNKNKYVLNSIKLQWKTKLEVINGYGGECKCCGEKNPFFLTVDHVNNDGTKRRKNGEPFGYAFYRMIIKSDFPDIYQILCMNCNLGKHINGGECPHTAKEIKYRSIKINELQR